MHDSNNFKKELLQSLVSDEKKNNKKLYSSGPYWNYKNTKTLYHLNNSNLNNFRGFNSGIGTSFTDNLVLDIRNELNLQGRIASSIFSIPFVKKLYQYQLRNSLSHIQSFLRLQSIIYKNNIKVNLLLKKYRFDNTTLFGCEQKFFKKKFISTHYLEIANRVNNLRKYLNFNNIKTFFEIGGGFGSNIHFLLSNFKNIKKIIYLDIVPNIYIGTEYLRTFYKKSVIDYLATKSMKSIEFKNNSSLEIYCIPPWEIEKLNIKIDHFHNADSFVEMPVNVVKNYIKFIKKIKTKNISLISYGDYDTKTTFSPKTLINLFKSDLSLVVLPGLIENFHDNNIYITGKLK